MSLILNGDIESIQGDVITVRVTQPEGVNTLRVRQLADGRKPSAAVEIEDGRSISPDQRRKIWALIGDYADYTGYDPIEMEAWVKVYYMADTGRDYFSISSCSMSQASDFLNYVISFGFKYEIPWKLKHMDEIPSAYPLMMQCLKHRMCVICGKHADIDHEPPIGSGRDRTQIDNRRYKFFPLCRTHHSLRHEMGIDAFMDFYHIKPVKLDEETLISLKLNSRAQFDRFDGKGASK
ncbi:putative HNHc nuclease [Lacticaseibacillus absianus]|uniref:putative HNHc nuclease n=1 Tax=Lacticaseibacillus absianus TaxID=2729623 RepID=UPI0015CBA7F3|nr:putative HNHc nuclease [Lacticaseibacillus absianus]